MSDASCLVTWLGDWLAGGGSLLLLSDYDGTLTPIVDRPDDAWLAEETRGDLQTLAESPRVHLGFVSGRDLADLRERVGVPNAIYAGCHGLEIEGPGLSFRHPEAEAQQDTLNAISRQMSLRAPTVPGMCVEPKRFGLAVHYRHVDRDQMGRVEMELARAIQQTGGRLKVFHGSEVIEIQPQVAWNKGDCVLWIRDVIQRACPAPPMVLYLGDDWTDEHAFEALAGQGITIKVGSEAPASKAGYRIPDVAGVRRLLSALADRAGRGDHV
jgi:trehalose-phosphatase